VTKNRDSKPSNLVWNRVDLTEAIALFLDISSYRRMSPALAQRKHDLLPTDDHWGCILRSNVARKKHKEAQKLQAENHRQTS